MGWELKLCLALRNIESDKNHLWQKDIYFLGQAKFNQIVKYSSALQRSPKGWGWGVVGNIRPKKAISHCENLVSQPPVAPMSISHGEKTPKYLELMHFSKALAMAAWAHKTASCPKLAISWGSKF